MSDTRREKEELRQKRAEIDREILRLLGERAGLSRAFAAAHPGQPSTLPSTEKESLDALAAATSELPAEAVRGIFREVHAACRALEARPRALSVGAEGGAAWAVARRQFGPLASHASAQTVEQAIVELGARRADFAVVPYETAEEGPLLSTLLPLRKSELLIVSVQELGASLSLLSATGARGDVEKVAVTPRDRGAAQRVLAELAPRAVLFDVASPVEACRMAKADKTVAAVALEPVGRDHDLSTVAPLAGRDPRARYAVVTARPASRTGHDATVILFSVSDEPGALFEVLKDFADRAVNLRKIHSWSVPSEDWGYLFFLEVSGHVTDRALVSVLEGMKARTKTLRVVGSFPV